MLGEAPAIYEDVVEEDEDAAAKEWSEHQIHESLECCRGVGQAKRHD